MSSKPQSNCDRSSHRSDDVEKKNDLRRRHFLQAAVGITATAGFAVATYPFLDSLEPSEKARAKGGPVTVDISGLAVGEQTTVLWRGKPVWVLRRTGEEIRALSDPQLRSDLRDPDSQKSTQPAYARNSSRSLRPEYFVCIANCTHLGCVPLLRTGSDSVSVADERIDGYYCPCHGSKFDLAGRVVKGVPAPTNLQIPPYFFPRDDKLVIGISAGSAA